MGAAAPATLLLSCGSLVEGPPPPVSPSRLLSSKFLLHAVNAIRSVDNRFLSFVGRRAPSSASSGGSVAITGFPSSTFCVIDSSPTSRRPSPRAFFYASHDVTPLDGACKRSDPVSALCAPQSGSLGPVVLRPALRCRTSVIKDSAQRMTRLAFQ